MILGRGILNAHLKLDTSSNWLSIGCKKSTSVERYFDRLPSDLFDEEHYYLYKRKGR